MAKQTAKAAPPPKQELLPAKKADAKQGSTDQKPPRPPRGPAARTDQSLTIEQEAYCRCRAMGMSQEESLAKSEIKRALSTVRKWESHSALVRARINELSQVATDRAIENTGLNREYVLTRLKTVVERCLKAEEVLDSDGKPTGVFVFDSKGANGALKLLGDTLGMFRPKPPSPGDDLAELSDDEIARIATELATQTGLAGHIARAKTA